TDALPVGVEIVRLEIGAEGAQHRGAVDRRIAAVGEVAGEGGGAHLAAAVGEVRGDFRHDAEARDTAEGEHVAAIAGFGQGGDAAGATNGAERRTDRGLRYG